MKPFRLLISMICVFALNVNAKTQEHLTYHGITMDGHYHIFAKNLEAIGY